VSESRDISLSRGLPETVLPDPPPQWSAALEQARALPEGERHAGLAAVARAYPTYLAAWAALAETSAEAGDDVAGYAYARVGYHRGLDALRSAGWKGSGYVRWEHPANRGFLVSLDLLRREAAAIGEDDEAERCRIFLNQLDPSWSSSPH
jgi:hypothetical protein